MTTQVTVLVHAQPINNHYPTSTGRATVKIMGSGRDGESCCTQLSRALRIGGISTLQTQLGSTMPTPVSPTCLLSQRWPAPPISNAPAPIHVQDMNKPLLVLAPRQEQEYLPTPPATPSTAGPVVPFMFTLPNETLDRIFSFLPIATLPILMQANKLCHALAERQLYFKVQHIGLYESQDNEDNKNWQCLRTLASRSSAAASVRHFAVRGLPWLDPSATDLLLRILRNMTKLCSLHLDIGALFEKALIRDKSAISTLAGSLCALNVTDAQTAITLCAAVSASREYSTAPSTSTPSLSALRIASESPLDNVAVQELLLALTQGRTGDLQLLQLTVACVSEDELLRMLGRLGKSLPSLETLGLQVRLTGLQSECGHDCDSEKSRVSDLSGRIGQVLGAFPALRKFSLASHLPSAPLRIGVMQRDAELITKSCQRLELLELQWYAWRVQATAEGQSCKVVSPPDGYASMRINWVYEHASVA